MLSSRIFFMIFVFPAFGIWIYPTLMANNMQTGFPSKQARVSQKSRFQDSLQIARIIENGFRNIEDNKSPKEENKFFNTIEKAVQIARKADMLVYVGNKLNRIADQLRDETRYALCIKLYKKCIEIGEEAKDNRLIIYSYNDIGVVYRRIDDYKKAMKYNLKALRMATETRDSVSSAAAANSVGNVYLLLGNYDQALQYFKQSLQLEQNRNNPIGIAINMNNIGRVYDAKRMFAKALKYFELSLDINRRINSKKGIAICNNDIAHVLKEQGKYRQALIFSLSAVKIAGETKNYYNLSDALIETGSLYSTLKDYKKAVRYLESGIQMAKRAHTKATLKNGYDALFRTYMEMKKYKPAIQFLELKQAYQDSLLNLELRKSIAKMQIKFGTEKQKNQIQLQKQKTNIAMLRLKKQNYLLYFSWSIFFILIIVLAFISYYLYNKNKQNRLLLEKNKEIEKTQKELVKTNEAMKQAIEKAEKSTRAKTNFLANMSHEIRTPLNSVIGFSDLLFDMITDEKQKDYLLSIKTSGESLISLINDILDLSKIEEGNITTVFKEISLRKIVKEVTNIFGLKASEKGIQLLTEIDNTIPDIIIFEESRLRQLLLNLVGNAVKFTQKGSVTISARAEKEAEENMIKLILEITDTGPGIPKEEQENVFMPFHQISSGKNTQGTGLGLAISQRLANAMDGKISLESTPGKGSCFTITFPRVQTSEKSSPLSSPTTKQKKDKKKKCLFINQTHPAKEEIKQLFISHEFEIKDAGLDLSQAKKLISDFRLIVFCCLEEEILENAKNIFEKENLDKKHLFLILNINENISIDQTKAVTINLYNQPMSEIISSLREFIRQFDEDECARHLFDLAESTNKPKLSKEVQILYNTYFEPAMNTKMFDKIELFTQKVLELANKFHLRHLADFANDLNQHLKNFDIVAIEKQLRIYKKAYQITFSDT